MVDPADGDSLVLKGETEGFEGFPSKFGEFIEKEDASVGKGHFPGFCLWAPSYEGMGGHVVVGAPEGSVSLELMAVKFPCYAVDGGDFQYFLFIHGRENGGEQPGHERLTSSGDPYQEKVVVPCNSCCKVREDVVMSNDVDEIAILAGFLLKDGVLVCFMGREMQPAFQVLDNLCDGLTGDDLQSSTVT